MPSARSASSAARKPTQARAGRAPAPRPQAATRSTRPRPHATGVRGAARGIRWDRLGRVLMLGVFALVAIVLAHGASSFLQTRAEAQQEAAIVAQLQAEHHQLLARDAALRRPQTIISDARALGMVRAGEQSFAVTRPPGR